MEYAFAALALIPAYIAAGLDIADHVKDTTETIEQINKYNEEIVVLVETFIVDLHVTTVDATVTPQPVTARATIPSPSVAGGAAAAPTTISGRAQALSRTVGAADEIDEANPVTVVQGRKTVVETRSGTGHITTDPDTMEGSGISTPPPDDSQGESSPTSAEDAVGITDEVRAQKIEGSTAVIGVHAESGEFSTTDPHEERDDLG